jgi:hypothetical protein
METLMIEKLKGIKKEIYELKDVEATLVEARKRNVIMTTDACERLLALVPGVWKVGDVVIKKSRHGKSDETYRVKRILSTVARRYPWMPPEGVMEDGVHKSNPLEIRLSFTGTRILVSGEDSKHTTNLRDWDRDNFEPKMICTVILDLEDK